MRTLIVTLALLLSGCANMVWVHPTKGEQAFHAELAECQFRAAQAFPTQMVQIGGTTSTTNTYGSNYGNATCFRNGAYVNCTGYGSGTSTSTTYQQPPISVDANQRNRTQMIQSCMRGNGWSLVEKR